MSIITHIQNGIKKILASDNQNSCNKFDKFIELCQTYYDAPVHSLSEMKQRNNNKIRGDIFEHFALLYFKHLYTTREKKKLSEVWLYSDVPENIKLKLNLGKNDMGIDLIGHENGNYYAIQVKYRKRNAYKQKTGITWKQLSTFYALVLKTGPFSRHIVFTNVDYARHVGKKTSKDQSICLGTLQNLSYHEWSVLAGIEGQSCRRKFIILHNDLEKPQDDDVSIDDDSEEEYRPSVDKLRRKREQYFDKLFNVT